MEEEGGVSGVVVGVVDGQDWEGERGGRGRGDGGGKKGRNGEARTFVNEDET